MPVINGFRSDLIEHFNKYFSSIKSFENESEISLYLRKCLSQKGKLLNKGNDFFSWGEFYLALQTFENRRVLTEPELDTAMGIELILLSADMIDDLCDLELDSDCDFDYQTFLLASQYSMIKGLNLLSLSTHGGKIDSVFRQLILSCLGEMKDTVFSFSLDKWKIPTEEDYMKLIHEKSGALSQVISVAINPSNTTLHQITKYIGIAGQIKNDVCDVMIEKKNDLIHLKAYLPLIKAVEYSEFKKDYFFKKLSNKDILTSIEIRSSIREYIRESGSVDYCLLLSNSYFQEAFSLLQDSFCISNEELNYFKTLILGEKGVSHD